MDCKYCESSGTDDDLLPSNQHLIAKGDRILGNGRSSFGSASFSKIRTDMEAHIRHLEQEAYSAVLRAFKAQSDAITWDKEHLITELRKELRVSDDQHRELLTKVNGDEIIKSIREWRQAGGHQAPRSIASQPLQSPTISGSRKKQKTSQFGQQIPVLSSMKYNQYPSTGLAGNHHHLTRSYSGALAANYPTETANSDPLIGRKILTRWPEDNSFYEAEIVAYNSMQGLHALVYDKDTENESFEWVDLKQISPDDIQWGEDDPGISYPGVHGGLGRGVKRMTHSGYPSVGRGRGSTRVLNRRDFPPPQNGFAKLVSDDIELLNTESLVQEVEKMFSLSHLDPHELEKAKKLLKEHEQALVEAIARLADASDVESGEHQFLHAQAMDQ